MAPREVVKTKEKDLGVEEVVLLVPKTMIVDETVQGWSECEL